MANSVVRAPRPTDVQSHTMTVHDIIHNSLIDRAVEHLPQIALTIVIAIVVSTILRRLIGRATNRAIKKNPTETRRDARLKTLASVGKSTASPSSYGHGPPWRSSEPSASMSAPS